MRLWKIKENIILLRKTNLCRHPERYQESLSIFLLKLFYFLCEYVVIIFKSKSYYFENSLGSSL
jgi:hypothetical protein